MAYINNIYSYKNCFVEMRRIKPAGDYMADISRFSEKLRSKFKDFVASLKSEGKETRAAYELLNKAAKGQLKDESGNKRSLTEEEIKMIKEQTVDVLRVLGLTSLSILPGGTLVFILIKVFKQEDRVYPSSFKNRDE
jgi:hypothetical protein